MDALLKSIDYSRDKTITVLIIVLGLTMVACLTMYVFLPLGDYIVNEFTSGAGQLDYTSL